MQLNPLQTFRNLYHHRNLIRQLAWRDFIGKCRRRPSVQVQNGQNGDQELGAQLPKTERP